MLRYKYYLILILCGLQLSCYESNDGDTIDANTYEQNKFVHELLLDRYLWYQEVPPVINYNDFDSPEQTLDFLKYHELDNYSYIADAAVFASLFDEGQYMGYGFSFFIESDGTVPLKFVYNDSPAGREGLQRGDQILSINGQPVGQITATEWPNIFGPKEDGYPVTMQVHKKDGSDDLDISMTKTLVNINTILHHSVIPYGNDRVGYLVFNSFLSTSEDELATVFSGFAEAGVNRLIVDFRYNGGGSVPVAQTLASYMRITDNTDTAPGLFALLQQNDKHRNLNTEYEFLHIPNELNLEQVVVITTRATASASEMLINGLKPFIDVTTVGSDTWGKPVGMNAFLFDNDNKVILPITFRIYNQSGDSYSFDGIPADCFAQDDLNFSFGDIDGPMLSAALFVTQNNTCSPAMRAQKIMTGIKPESPYSLQSIIGAY